MNNQGKNIAKTKQPSVKSKKKTDGHFIVDSHEILDGAVKVLRTTKSGQFWTMAYWIRGESKYFRRSLKTKNLEEAKELAREKYFELMGDIKSGNRIFTKTAKVLVDDFVKHKMEEAKAGQITLGRVETIRISLNKWFLNFVGRTKKLDKINRHEYTSYYIWRRKQSPEVKNATLINERALISSLYKFGIMHGYLRHDQTPVFPRMSLKQSQVERRDSFELEEWEKIFRSFRRWVSKASDERDKINRQFVRDFIILSANTGLRFGEMRKLKWNMVRLSKDKTPDLKRKDDEYICEIAVPMDTKTGARNVTGRRGSIFLRIKSYSKHIKSQDYIFVNNETGEPLHKKVYYKLWDNLMKEADLSDSHKNISFYSLRHTYITFRLLAGVNPFILAQNVGTSLKMIEDHYAHIKSDIVKRELTKNMRLDEAGQILLG